MKLNKNKISERTRFYTSFFIGGAGYLRCSPAEVLCNFFQSPVLVEMR